MNAADIYKLVFDGVPPIVKFPFSFLPLLKFRLAFHVLLNWGSGILRGFSLYIYGAPKLSSPKLSNCGFWDYGLVFRLLFEGTRQELVTQSRESMALCFSSLPSLPPHTTLGDSPTYYP